MGVDRLVEDSKDQYYGYSCTESQPVAVGSKASENRCDLTTITGEVGRDGITDTFHDYTEEQDAAYRKDDWWPTTKMT